MRLFRSTPLRRPRVRPIASEARFARRHRMPVAVGAVILAVSCAALGPAWAMLSDGARIVVLKGRQYEPADLYLRRGDAITLVNGETSAIHHAFIEADRFSFDAGDQRPGSRATLTLAERGDFVLRCGIHPKMKLTVHVQ